MDKPDAIHHGQLGTKTFSDEVCEAVVAVPRAIAELVNLLDQIPTMTGDPPESTVEFSFKYGDYTYVANNDDDDAELIITVSERDDMGLVMRIVVT